MKIQAVMIDGFKNLSNVKITFDNITALVALNNFGKSNVLSGIDFGLTFIKSPIDNKMEMMANSNLIPINQSMQGRNYKFEVEVLTEDAGQEYRVQYGYEFSWQCDEEDEPEIVHEYLKIKLDEKGQKYTQLISRTKEFALYKSSETGRCSSNIKVESSELVVNKLKAYDELYYAEIISKLNGMRMYMENNLDAKSFYKPDPIIRKGFEKEMINADNLPRIIFNLKKQNPNKFELLKDVYFQLFPDVEDVIVKNFKINAAESDKLPDDAPFIFSNSIYVLFVKDKNLVNPVNFSMMSDGAKRVFMILTKIIVSSVSNISLIAIEEPENSVHPGLFQAYMQIINQLLDDCKVIITSHSPYIISYLEPAWIHVGVNRQPGVAKFFAFKKSGQKQLENDASGFNLSMGDYLFSMLADSESNISDYLECDVDE
ncbi:AAA family ATPase [Anaerosacchariphilus polymeriproducens]|uniref:ATP-binding protein n=1 Tax=Anaerosacchariphilus polymeriproducens TaxID=1812858 RepID=A0A371AYT2_9FIRM|nr:ATP-binding protein [Anaerosacchariphilus polymeriproducens]RDU24709.1 ATP-binding protein [Anaerosacchariphilus polymeriproducens]